MPSYTPSPIVVDDCVISAVKDSWHYAMHCEDTPQYKLFCDEYVANGGDEENLSPIVFFYDTFYARLFSVFPEYRAKFHNLQRMGCMLVRMFAYIIKQLAKKPSKVFKRELHSLAVTHNGRGVGPFQYSVMGAVIIYTVRTTSGDRFTEKMERAWLHVWGWLMQMIIPVVVKGKTSAPTAPPSGDRRVHPIPTHLSVNYNSRSYPSSMSRSPSPSKREEERIRSSSRPES